MQINNNNYKVLGINESLITISFIANFTKGHWAYVYVSIPGTRHGLIGYNEYSHYNEKAGSVGRNFVKRFAKEKVVEKAYLYKVRCVINVIRIYILH